MIGEEKTASTLTERRRICGLDDFSQFLQLLLILLRLSGTFLLSLPLPLSNLSELFVFSSQIFRISLQFEEYLAPKMSNNDWAPLDCYVVCSSLCSHCGAFSSPSL
jgi:hypothetical protein